MLAIPWMQLFVLLEPKELAIDPLGTLVVPQFFLLLLIKLDIIEFDLILQRRVIFKHDPILP